MIKVGPCRGIFEEVAALTGSRLNVTIQELAALWHTTPTRVKFAADLLSGPRTSDRGYRARSEVVARVWARCGQATRPIRQKPAALCPIFACRVGDRAKLHLFA
jgi:hypothetical protein